MMASTVTVTTLEDHHGDGAVVVFPESPSYTTEPLQDNFRNKAYKEEQVKYMHKLHFVKTATKVFLCQKEDGQELLTHVRVKLKREGDSRYNSFWLPIGDKTTLMKDNIRKYIDGTGAAPNKVFELDNLDGGATGTNVAEWSVKEWLENGLATSELYIAEHQAADAIPGGNPPAPNPAQQKLPTARLLGPMTTAEKGTIALERLSGGGNEPLICKDVLDNYRAYKENELCFDGDLFLVEKADQFYWRSIRGQRTHVLMMTERRGGDRESWWVPLENLPRKVDQMTIGEVLKYFIYTKEVRLPITVTEAEGGRDVAGVTFQAWLENGLATLNVVFAGDEEPPIGALDVDEI